LTLRPRLRLLPSPFATNLDTSEVDLRFVAVTPALRYSPLSTDGSLNGRCIRLIAVGHGVPENEPTTAVGKVCLEDQNMVSKVPQT
jgi:hypothetical protein